MLASANRFERLTLAAGRLAADHTADALGPICFKDAIAHPARAGCSNRPEEAEPRRHHD
jgi:hypothetical protein